MLNSDGDLSVNEYGDISLTDSVKQAVRIRLQWFLNEWRFAPQFGIPYFEEILVKNPNMLRFRSIIRDAAESVEEVREARNVEIALDASNRSVRVSVDIVIGEEMYREEVSVHGSLRSYA